MQSSDISGAKRAARAFIPSQTLKYEQQTGAKRRRRPRFHVENHTFHASDGAIPERCDRRRPSETLLRKQPKIITIFELRESRVGSFGDLQALRYSAARTPSVGCSSAGSWPSTNTIVAPISAQMAR